MKIMQGRSAAQDAETAVRDAASNFDAAPTIILALASTQQDPDGLHQALSARFPDAQIAGCTTAGEQLGGEHSTGQLVLLGIADAEISWAVEAIHGLDALDESGVREVVDKAYGTADVDRDNIDPETSVCMLFVDGLRGAEEQLSALLADALEGMPLAGGSAGDDLGFKECRVFDRHGAHTNAAVIVVARSLDGTPIRIVKHQHFHSTETSVVVTKAEGRVVHEFDGYPALEGYARALNLEPNEVNPDVAFMNPVTFACNGELYVRSVQTVNDDGSITFYCAVEEGMVLDIGGHADMTTALDEGLGQAFGSRPKLVVGFNCILRALEATNGGLHESLGTVLAKHTENLVGFDTYGEQLNGLHINQTLVAVAFGADSKEEVGS